MFNPWNSHGPKIYKINLIKTMVNRLKSICSNKILLDRDLNQLKRKLCMEWLSKFIIEKCFKIAIKQKPKLFQNSGLDVPKKQIYFGFQYNIESSVKFVQNVSNLISKNFNFIKCVPYFKKGRNLLSYFSGLGIEIKRISILISILT